MLIAYTGGDTLYGEIVRSARGTAHARTPLQNAIPHLVTALVVLIGAATIVLTITLTQVPPLARALGLTPLHLDDWALAVAGSVVTAALVLLWPHGTYAARIRGEGDQRRGV